MKLIGITGKAGSGKDTAADYLVAQHGFVKYNLALPIKNAIDAILDTAFVDPIDWDDRGVKEGQHWLLGVSPRKAAQTLGTEWARAYLGDDFWLRCASAHIEMHRQMNSFEECEGVRGIVIPDIRFENEAAWLRGQGGTLLHVVRPGVGAVEAHISEAGVDMGPSDIMLINDGSVVDLLMKVGGAMR